MPLINASAHHYYARGPDQAQHTYELKRRNETILNLDYRQAMGNELGSNSCGPEPLQKYLLRSAEEAEFSVRIVPVEW